MPIPPPMIHNINCQLMRNFMSFWEERRRKKKFYKECYHDWRPWGPFHLADFKS